MGFASTGHAKMHAIPSKASKAGVHLHPRCTAPVVRPVLALGCPSTFATPTPALPRVAGSRLQTVVHFQNPESDTLTPLKDTYAAEVSKQAPTVSWAGAGIYFFWQLGAMKFLAERYDLTKVPMVGASGGALAAVLAGCGVPADLVLQRAYDLSLEHNVWERRLGLLGVWGTIIETWLDELLPDNAADMCRDRITIVVTTLPNMAQIGISDFTDKHDLINAAMASSHIPMFLDLKFARRCRGKYCIDGSFPDFFYNDNSPLLKNGGQAVIFDYFQDENLVRTGRMDMLKLRTYEEVKRNMEFGYKYAAKLHSEGRFDLFVGGEVAVDQLQQVARQ